MARYAVVSGQSFTGSVDQEQLDEFGDDVVYMEDVGEHALDYEEIQDCDAALVLGRDETALVEDLLEYGVEVVSPHPYNGAVQVAVEANPDSLYNQIVNADDGTATSADEPVDTTAERQKPRYGGRFPDRRIKCLIAKLGLDGHDRGAHVVSRAFRDAGFEVIYSGLHNTPEDVYQATIQEDADVLGISILSGAHNTLVPRVLDGLEEYGALDDTLVLVGGTIPETDQDGLYEIGVDEIFGPGTGINETIEYVRDNVPDR